MKSTALSPWKSAGAGRGRNSRCDGPHARVHAQSGVALVVTLILLAIITTLTIAFVALTHRETANVAAASSTTDAEFAAEAALERAKAEILARFARENAGTNNGNLISGPEMMVSVAVDQNRFSPAGAFVDPSPPVFVNTNPPGLNGPLDDRHFVDLNRNRYYDETGLVPITSDVRDPGTGRFARAYPEALGWDATNFVVGDPQWIGILSSPRRWHTNNNQYISRYAWMVLPAGRSLDLNAIHNQAIEQLDMRVGGFNGFYRNQGAGAWELNLAGFLTDLNTNEWRGQDYAFNPFSTVASGIALGTAFADAREILRYRYTPAGIPLTAIPVNPVRYLDTASSNFPPIAVFGGPPPATRLADDDIDEYANTPVLRIGAGPQNDDDNPDRPWPGARNKRNFRSIHDLWDPAKLPDPNGLRSRLANASLQGNSYDRYTYYRLLGQMGTDSVTEDEDKINLNYVNVRSWVDPSFRLEAADMVSWTNSTTPFVQAMGRKGPELFFLSVARKLFLQESRLRGIVTNASLPDRPIRIPLLVSNSLYAIERPNNNSPWETNRYYSGRIHQILQQAANLYDAIRGFAPNESTIQPQFPTVFRPQFEVDGNNVYITNYILQTDANLPLGTRDLEVAAAGSQSARPPLAPDDLVYNAPLIVGARKGHPNFNEFASQTILQAVRRLVVTKPANVTNLANSTVTQELTFEIQNRHAFETWYSYFSNAYPRPLRLAFSNTVVATLRSGSNSLSTVVWSTNYAPAVFPPLTFRTNTYIPSAQIPAPTFSRILFSWTNSGPVDAGGFTNDLSLNVRNQIRYYAIDTGIVPNRIVDAVTMTATNDFFDLNRYLAASIDQSRSAAIRELWSRRTSSEPKVNQGALSQIIASRNPGETTDNIWRNYGFFQLPDGARSKDDAIANFNHLLTTPTSVVQRIDVPFVAVRYVIQDNNWRASDPLVHYNADDLWRGSRTYDRLDTNQVRFEIGTKNPEAVAWPSDPYSATGKDPTLRDPGVKSSDLWNFPTNRLPTVGWIGRVHRGTPWQTIYLKAAQANTRAFHQVIGGFPYSDREGTERRSAAAALAMHPGVDARLLDIFTTAVHPNATRGRLSINQTNLAAWSAVFSGVDLRLAHLQDDDVRVWRPTNHIVEPDAIDPRLQRIVDGINEGRRRLRRDYRRLSELVAVPELTSDSPYLEGEGFESTAPVGFDLLADAEYERIPEQIFSLLKVGEPRFVVYSWGQSLKPAEYGVDVRGNAAYARGPSVETAGNERGLVRNYQITGEMATRTVIRIDFERLSSDPNSPLYTEFDYSHPHAVVESFNIVPLE